MDILQLRLYFRYSFFILFIILTCSCEQHSCVDGSLNQMSKSEVMDIFVNKKFPDISSTTFLNDKCEVVDRDSLMVYFSMNGDYIGDFYTDDENEIKVVVFRKTIGEDRDFLKALRDSIERIGKAEGEREIAVELVNIDCFNVSNELSSVYARDQENRSGNDINPSIDKANLSIVISILEKCDKSLFSEQDFNAIWAVLQHSDSSHMKKYLSLLEDAVDQDLLEASKIALMKDRILMSENKPQLYGSQVYMDDKGKWQVYRIKDADNVDERRAAVGLGPLSDYLSRWDIDYK